MNQKAPENLVKYAERVLGGIDHLVLNYAYTYHIGEWLGRKENFTMLERTVGVNFNAFVSIASHAMPHLESSKGSVIVMSSLYGKMTSPFTSHYTASKYALEGFFGSLREEFLMKENGVSVTICTIGLIGTDNALNSLNNHDPGLLIKFAKFGFTAASPSDTALHVIKGGAQRWNTIYYPKSHSTPLLTLRHFMPETMGAFTRYMWS